MAEENCNNDHPQACRYPCAINNILRPPRLCGLRSERDLRDSILPLHRVGCRPCKNQTLADPLNLGVLWNDEKYAGALQPLMPQSNEGFRHRALVVGNKDPAFKSGLA